MLDALRVLTTELPHICGQLAALTKALRANAEAQAALTEALTVHRWRMEHVDAKLAWLEELIAERTGARPDERHELLRLKAGRPRTGGLTG